MTCGVVAAPQEDKGSRAKWMMRAGQWNMPWDAGTRMHTVDGSWHGIQGTRAQVKHMHRVRGAAETRGGRGVDGTGHVGTCWGA